MILSAEVVIIAVPVRSASLVRNGQPNSQAAGIIVPVGTHRNRILLTGIDRKRNLGSLVIRPTARHVIVAGQDCRHVTAPAHHIDHGVIGSGCMACRKGCRPINRRRKPEPYRMACRSTPGLRVHGSISGSHCHLMAPRCPRKLVGLLADDVPWRFSARISDGDDQAETERTTRAILIV